MRVLHVCTYDRGGAANAALRIHGALREADVDSTVLVASKATADPTIESVPSFLFRGTPMLSARLEYWIARCLFQSGPNTWGASLLPGPTLRRIQSLRPDIVHLHWVSHGFLSIEQIGRLGVPIVWTLHDMWALTPGYGYRMEPGCALPSIQACENLMPGAPFARLARNIWARKRRAWRNLNAAVVAPSRWLAEEARRSEVLRGCSVHTIPYVVPLDLFRPEDRTTARGRLGLPGDRPLVLFGADVSGGMRKGGDLLAGALAGAQAKFTRSGKAPLLVVFGQVEASWANSAGCEIRLMGPVTEPERLASLYAACDVFVCPSREDNLPNTVLESLACGTPTVGFRIGGLPDLVEDGVNGYLAEPFDVEELGTLIARACAEQVASGMLGRNARARAEERWSEAAVVPRYLDVYREVLVSRTAEI